MSTQTIILFAGWGAICNVWLGLIIAQRRARRDGLLLEVAEEGPLPSPPHDRPSVCVVIAARNESAGLVDCVRHVLEQDYPNLSVRVIDDRSEDDTYEVAKQIAQTDCRVNVQRVETLPAGWMGKSHALWQGTRSADAEWFLFIDVDCTLKANAIACAVEEACDRGADFLTLWPQQAAGGFWEHATIPLCGGIIALWFGSPRVNDPNSAIAFANGQFILFRRTAYDHIGGHKAVRSAIIEDVPLAEHAKKSGLTCWVASGRELVSVRMYSNYDAIVRGWSRIYVGALRSSTKIALSVVWLVLGSLLPYVVAIGLATSLYSAWTTGSKIDIDMLYFAGLCVSHLVVMMVASYRFWGMGGCRRLDLLWYPLSVCVVMRILIQSWWWLTISRRIPWRDTHYAIDGRGRIVG